MMDRLKAPETKPPTGFTQALFSVEVLPSHLLVRVSHETEIAISLTDCFPVNRDQTRFTLRDQSLMEAAIAEAFANDRPYLTLPIPTRASDWWAALNNKAASFAGSIWLDETTTLQQLLIASGVYRATPSTPMFDWPSKPTPKQRPVAGLTARCKVVHCEGAADTWWIQYDPSFEFQVRLIDCYADELTDKDPKKYASARAAYIESCHALDAAQTIACTLPPPVNPSGWYAGLKRHSQQAGLLWLDNYETLNSRLVAKGLAKSSR